MSKQTPLPEQKPAHKHPKFSKKFGVVLALVILILIIASFVVQFRRADSKDTNKGQQYYAEQRERVGKLIILPKNEAPTIATVSDVSQLKEQDFYVDAQNGDLVFAYKNAHKAILYRPSQNVIVNVAPVTIK